MDSLDLALPFDTSAARFARRAFARCGSDPEVGVIVAELVTNAVQHGLPPVRVRANFTPDTVRVAVTAAEPNMGVRAADSAGLGIVEASRLRGGSPATKMTAKPSGPSTAPSGNKRTRATLACAEPQRGRDERKRSADAADQRGSGRPAAQHWGWGTSSRLAVVSADF